MTAGTPTPVADLRPGDTIDLPIGGPHIIVTAEPAMYHGIVTGPGHALTLAPEGTGRRQRLTLLDSATMTRLTTTERT